MKDSAMIAGLNVLRVINEPTAAAIAFGLANDSEQEKHVLVFDLGGSTFDVTLLSIDEGIFEVKAANDFCQLKGRHAGSSSAYRLGGDDFDNRLVQFCVADFKKSTGIDIKDNKPAIHRLRTQCEKVKCLLSKADVARLNCKSLAEGKNYETIITRDFFEDLCMDLFN